MRAALSWIVATSIAMPAPLIGQATISCNTSRILSAGRARGEQILTVECYIEGSLQQLRQYQISLPCCWTPEPGATGYICQVEWEESPPRCTSPFDPVCRYYDSYGNFDGSSLCDDSRPCHCDPSPCWPPGSQCDGMPNHCLYYSGINAFCWRGGSCEDPSPYINPYHADYVFPPPLPNNQATNNGNCSISEEPRLANALPAGVSQILYDGEPKYLGSFVYKVSACASGTFFLPILCGPFGNEVPCGQIGGTSSTDVTRMNEVSGPLIPYTPEGATVRVVPAEFCDCTMGAPCRLYGDSFPPGPPIGDCQVNVNDITCVLDGFAGRSPCDEISDISPCPNPDGVIDVNDIRAVLDAFAEVVPPSCEHACAGACCTASGCRMTHPSGCNGEFRGYGTRCGPCVCAGACRTFPGCVMTNQDSCFGAFQGYGSECLPSNCP